MKKSDTQEPEIITEVITLTPFESEVIALQEFVKDYDNYPVTEETYKEALKARAAVRDKRYSIDRTLKANNDVLNKLKGGQKTKADTLYEIVCPVEDRLDRGIKSIENKREEAKAQKAREEEERLAKIEEEKRLAMEAELKAEKDRLEAIRIEQEAKEKELKEKEQAILKKQEEDRKAAEAKIREQELAAKAEIDRKNKEAQEKIDKANSELRAKEEAHQKAVQEDLDRKRKEQEETDARLRAKEEAIEKEKKDIQDKKDRELAEKEAEEDRLQQEEAERLLKIEEDKRQAALRPDKEKLLAFAEMIGAIEYPVLSGEQQSKVILEQVQATVIGLQVWIKKAVETI